MIVTCCVDWIAFGARRRVVQCKEPATYRDGLGRAYCDRHNPYSTPTTQASAPESES